ncbi:MAG: hypothetical protein LLF96_09210, partial [Eubacteriales bacterium]|nr:hypothetical protein [Eubacteriales bacterium]
MLELQYGGSSNGIILGGGVRYPRDDERKDTLGTDRELIRQWLICYGVKIAQTASPPVDLGLLLCVF